MRVRSSAASIALLLGLASRPLLAASAPAAPVSEIDQKVESYVKQMTLEEKIDLISGVDDFYVRGVPRLGIPHFRMADGPMGVRNDGPATAFGGGIALTASFNPELAGRIGVEFGREARAKGVHFLLAPAVNIYRSPLAARNFEYMGEDPFLAGHMALAYVKGVQSQGVSATIKHFMGNNSEYDRNNSDSLIDERTMREIYLPAFETVVKEGDVGAVMDAYNLVNGVHMSANGPLNIGVLKKEWGFSGVLMSDWFSVYDGVGAANGGLDVEMPIGKAMNRENLLPAVKEGKVKVAELDDKARRILRTALRFGWFERQDQDFTIPRYNPQGREAALQGAREGIVLLKNAGALLPLDRAKTSSVLVVGPSAYPAVSGGGGSSTVQTFTAISILEGVSKQAGAKTAVHYARGIASNWEMVERTRWSTSAEGGEGGLRAQFYKSEDLSGEPFKTAVDWRVDVGRPWHYDFPEGTRSERWTGYFTPEKAGEHDVLVASNGDGGGLYRLYVDDKLVIDSWTIPRALLDYETLTLDARPHKVVLEHHGRPKWPPLRLELGISRHGERVEHDAKTLAAKVDVVVVAVGFDPGSESESADRTFRLPPAQDELIKTMAALNKNVIVVTTAGGGIDMRGWIEEVPGILHAWYPGQEGGAAVGEILFGDVNPSGHLPATFERRPEDNPSFSSYYPAPGTLKITYKEGIFVGYRGYEKNGVAPLFPFGHGLSYTTFQYANLGVTPATTKDGRVQVSFDITNTGKRPGADVAQVYVGEAKPTLPRPVKELKGFAKVQLKPGETQRVTIDLDRRALSYYDVAARQWAANPGTYQISVGRSSADIALTGTLTLAK